MGTKESVGKRVSVSFVVPMEVDRVLLDLENPEKTKGAKMTYKLMSMEGTLTVYAPESDTFCLSGITAAIDESGKDVAKESQFLNGAMEGRIGSIQVLSTLEKP